MLFVTPQATPPAEGLLVMMGIIGAVLLAAVALGALIFFIQRLLNPDPSPVQERLAALRGKPKEEVSSEENALAKKMAAMYKSADYQNMTLGKFLEKYPFIHQLKRNLYQAGMKNPVDRFFMTWYAAPALIGLVLALINPIFLVLGLVVPIGANIMISLKKKKRLHRFTLQFPDALNLMTSSLRAGHSFQSALTVVASELQDPISTEFTLVVKDFNLGVPVREALFRLMSNLDDLADVRMFVTAVLIQRESGGNLAEILDKLSYTIRERFKLKGQVSAMTGQSRLTGYCLGAAPFVVLVILFVISPGYLDPLFKEDIGHIALGVALFLQVAGFFVIRKIVDIRV